MDNKEYYLFELNLEVDVSQRFYNFLKRDTNNSKVVYTM